ARQACCVRRQERRPRNREAYPFATARTMAAGVRFRRVHSRSEFFCTRCAPSHPLSPAAALAAVPCCMPRSQARVSLQRFVQNSIREKQRHIPALPLAAKRNAHSASPFRAANAVHAFPKCRRAISTFPSIAGCPRGNRPPSIPPTSATAFPAPPFRLPQARRSLPPLRLQFPWICDESFPVPPSRREF